MERFKQNKNFNIASTVINENVRVSTAAIFYESDFFGNYYQLETWVFTKDHKNSKMKIHNVPANQNGIDYCKRFHEKAVTMVRNKLKKTP